jgi:hypothetical protein
MFEIDLLSRACRVSICCFRTCLDSSGLSNRSSESPLAVFERVSGLSNRIVVIAKMVPIAVDSLGRDSFAKVQVVVSVY